MNELNRQQERQTADRASWGPGWVDTGLVFTRVDGRGVRPEYVSRHFQKLAAEYGLPPIRLHDLRHTNASLALQAGVDLKVVSERLGHSKTSITADIYTHVAPTVGQAAARRIAEVIVGERVANEHDRLAVSSESPASEPQNGH